MRGLIWIVLLFVVAALAAGTLGRNDGLVSIFFAGWRTDLSLNFFVLLVLAAAAALVTLAQAVSRLVTLPRRASDWRAQRREHAAHAALREALLEFYSARYSRARKAAQRALALREDTPGLAEERDFDVLSLLLAAGSAHRLQDRAGRIDAQQRALALAREARLNPGVEDGIQMLAAEWALDDRDAPRAQEALAALTPGAARRTQALRLKMQASRSAREPLEALRMAHLLANHQAFSAVVAQGLLRSLAGEVIDQARDAEQLRRLWQQLDPADRADAAVLARAVQRAVELGDAAEARRWLQPGWDNLVRQNPEDRDLLALALFDAATGIGPEWLPALERAELAQGADAPILAAVGAAYAECGLYGKARRPLESAAASPQLPARVRRAAWRRLAGLARREGDEARATACERAAAELG